MEQTSFFWVKFTSAMVLCTRPLTQAGLEPQHRYFGGGDGNFILAASSRDDLWLLLLPLCISQQLPRLEN